MFANAALARMLHEQGDFNAKAAKSRKEAQKGVLRGVDASFYGMQADSVLIHRCFSGAGDSTPKIHSSLLTKSPKSSWSE